MSRALNAALAKLLCIDVSRLEASMQKLGVELRHTREQSPENNSEIIGTGFVPKSKSKSNSTSTITSDSNSSLLKLLLSLGFTNEPSEADVRTALRDIAWRNKGGITSEQIAKAGTAHLYVWLRTVLGPCASVAQRDRLDFLPSIARMVEESWHLDMTKESLAERLGVRLQGKQQSPFGQGGLDGYE